MARNFKRYLHKMRRYASKADSKKWTARRPLKKPKKPKQEGSTLNPRNKTKFKGLRPQGDKNG